MKKNIIIILIILFVPIFTYMILSSNEKSNSMSVNAKSAKPQIIKFTSTMCLDCQTMNKIMKEIYPEYKDNIELVEIQVQDNKSSTRDWIKKYDVTLVPTIILKNANGEQVRRIEGAIDKDVLKGYLKGLK